MGSIYESQVDEWLSDDKLFLLECWARDGYTLTAIADRMQISDTTLKRWMKKYPEINNAIKSGKEIIDYRVENALLKAALGYTATEIEVTVGKQVKNGQTFQITKTTRTKEVAPNVTACLAWLNNRCPDKWKRTRDKEVTVSDEDSNLSITIVRQGKDTEESLNEEIKIETKGKSSREKESPKKMDEDDKDYWPEDWEDDE